MFVVILFVIVSNAVSEDCDYVSDNVKICTKVYHPEDLLSAPSYNPIELSFVNLKGSVNLTLPQKLNTTVTEYATYKRFFLSDSCVTNIQDNFFRDLDRNKQSLRDITFVKVSCLTTLSKNVFNGIGSFVKMLTFDTMINLTMIDIDFFDQLIILEKLTIANTGIKMLPEHMLTKLPKLTVFNAYNNQLVAFPWIPQERRDLNDKINAYNNPFNCRCSLQFFVDSMKNVLSSNSYKCATPKHLQGKSLIDVDLCGSQTATLKAVKTLQNSLAKATIRIELIVVVSLIVLILVIIVIITVLYMRHNKAKKQQSTYDQRSPSKIIFQNEAEYQSPLVPTYYKPSPN